MSLREQIAEQLNGLTEAELRRVAEYLGLARIRATHESPPQLDEARLATLYSEAAAEDRALADAGVSDYAAALLKEDSR